MTIQWHECLSHQWKKLRSIRLHLWHGIHCCRTAGQQWMNKAVFAAGGEYSDSRTIQQWMDPWPLCNFCFLFLSWWNHSKCIFQCPRICPWQPSSGVRTNLQETWDSVQDNGGEVLHRFGIWESCWEGLPTEIGPGPARLFCSNRTWAKSRASTLTAGYRNTTDCRVGDAYNAGFISTNKRLFHLWRARRATNCPQDVCVAVLYASTNGWYKRYKPNTQYLYAAPKLHCKRVCLVLTCHLSLRPGLGRGP